MISTDLTDTVCARTRCVSWHEGERTSPMRETSSPSVVSGVDRRQDILQVGLHGESRRELPTHMA